MKYSDLLAAFSDFLIVFIHLVIYRRNVYPQSAFKLVRAFGCATYQCRHPKVIAYIEDVSLACMASIRKGVVSRLSIVISTVPQQVPLERFVIDLTEFPSILEESGFGDFEVTAEGQDSQGFSYEEEFRAALVSFTSTELGLISEPVTFTMVMETDDDTLNPNNWITSDGSLTSKTPLASRVPIRNVNTGPTSFDLWSEDFKGKGKLKMV